MILMGDFIKEGDRLILSNPQKFALDKFQKVGSIDKFQTTGYPRSKMVTRALILFFSLDLC